jgi:hypothetical protein
LLAETYFAFVSVTQDTALIDDEVRGSAEQSSGRVSGFQSLLSSELTLLWTLICCSHDCCRTVNAFLNSGQGGTIYLGVADDGKVLGIMLNQYKVCSRLELFAF